jgi:hypothetical protein
MLKFKMLVVFCWLGPGLFAQDIGELLPASAGAWSRVFHSPAAALINPAVLGIPADPAIVLMSKRPFLVKDLSAMQLYATHPVTGQGNIFIGCYLFGNPSYTELTLSAGYGLQLNKWLQLGIAAHGTFSKVKGSLRSFAITPAISLQYSKGQTLGGVFMQYRSSPAFSVPAPYWIAGAGIGRDWSGQLYTDLIVYYSYQNGFNNMVSVQYRVLQAWILVGRVQTRPFRYAFETGYQKHRFSLRICTEWHPQMGFSPGILLNYQAKSSNN